MSVLGEAADSQPPDDFRPAVPLTPAACLETIAARMDRLHQGAAGMLLRAVPVKTGGTGKVYGGFIYAALKDPRTNDLIDCRIPEALARDLEWNREAVFAGLLRYKPGRAARMVAGARDENDTARPGRLSWPGCWCREKKTHAPSAPASWYLSAPGGRRRQQKRKRPSRRHGSGLRAAGGAVCSWSSCGGPAPACLPGAPDRCP